jgi:hypothetical protein
MVEPRIPPQPPIISGTRTMADIQQNERVAAHERQDELAARGRTSSGRSRDGVVARVLRVLSGRR